MEEESTEVKKMCMYVHMCVHVPLYQAKGGLGKAYRVILRTSSR